MRFRVESPDVGDRLDVVVARHVGLSRSAAGRRIEAGDVFVDDTPGVKSHRCAAGETVEIAEETAARPRPPPMPPVRYQDEHLAVIAKPAGLVVHPGAGHRSDTLVDALRASGWPAVGDDPDRPGIVHRLDRDTSGLLLVARSEAGHSGLIRQLADREVERVYLALVAGSTPERARLDGPIGRHPTDRTRFAVVANGKPAVTRWRRLAATEQPTTSLLTCTLESGRTHQIRVHAAAAGHPVAGDDRYGGGPLGRELALERMFLHAARLAFEHPISGDLVVFTEPLPTHLATVLQALGQSPSEALERL